MRVTDRDREVRVEELRRIREERGMSQGDLAAASGVDRVTINQVERGRRKPSLGTLEKLATALGVELADLFPKAQAPLPLEEGGDSSQPTVWQGAAHFKGSGTVRAEGEVIKKIRQIADQLDHGMISREEAADEFEEQARKLREAAA
jgi:transcriptional regulator with XRE-family HTH domain